MRKTYIDNIRWITVLTVFLFHVIYMFNGIAPEVVIGPFSGVQYQDALIYPVYPWFMVLLFAVSGMSARYYLNSHTDREFRRTRTTKLLVPSTIGLFVFWWIMGYFNMKVAGAFDSDDISSLPIVIRYIIMALSGTGVLWYIQMLWVFSMALTFVRKIEKDRLYNITKKTNVAVLLALTIPVWGASRILNLPIVTYRFGIYTLVFFIGYFIFSHDEVMDRLEKCWLPLTIAAVCLAGVFTKVFWMKPFAEHETLDTFLCNLYAWTATLAILAFMKRWGDRSNGFTRWMAKESWGLYLFHYLTLIIPAYYITTYLKDIPPVAVYLICAIISFGGAVGLSHLISKIPFLRWAVKGEKKNVQRQSHSAEKA